MYVQRSQGSLASGAAAIARAADMRIIMADCVCLAARRPHTKIYVPVPRSRAMLLLLGDASQ